MTRQTLQAPLLTNPPVEFIENRLDESLHPAFICPGIQYDRAKGRFVEQSQSALSPGAITPQAKKDYYAAATAALHAFQARLPGAGKKPLPAEAGTVTINSWKEVLGLIDDAVKEYNSAGKVKKGMRKLGDLAPAIQSWITLFPSTSYSQVLVAGLKLVLDASSSVNKVRESVLGMLSEIPYRICKTKEYVDMYNDPTQHARVHTESSKIYAAILEAVGLMLDWLGRKTKFLAALGKGPNYGKDIQDKLGEIDKLAQNLKEEADICAQKNILQVQSRMEDQKEAVATLGVQLEHGFGSMAIQQEYGFGSMAMHQEQALLMLGNVATRQQQAVGILNDMLLLLSASPRARAEQEGGAPYAIKPLASRKTFARDVFAFLDYTPETVADDLAASFAAGRASGPTQKDRVNLVLKSPELIEWLAKSTSAALLINGHSELEFISPMSHLCAFLAEALKKQSIPGATYFCGLRCSADAEVSARDLVKSLIGQLMSRFDFDLSFVKGKRKKLGRLKGLFWLLQELLERLPENTVLFWIIDGVSYFESSKRVADTQRVFEELLRITRVNTGLVLKLLVTSPYRSCEVAQLWRSEGLRMLEVPTHVDGERQGTFAMTLDEASGIAGSGQGKRKRG